MILKKAFLLVLIYLVATETFANVKRVILESYEGCKGARSKDCSKVTYRKVNDAKLRMDFDVTEDFAITSGKTEGFASGNLIFRFRAKNPCDHLLISTIYRAAMNITDDCIVRKGQYVLIMDVTEVGQRFYNNFPLTAGNLTVITKYYGKKCNFVCSTLVLSIGK